jgi:hypothetical protein
MSFILGVVLYSGRNPISAPSRKNALFRINIIQEPDLRLIRRFFKSSLRLLSMLSNIFSLAALTFFSLEALL